jgi:hypothetical protein
MFDNTFNGGEKTTTRGYDFSRNEIVAGKPVLVAQVTQTFCPTSNRRLL